jgi:hypothetical protein
MEERGREVNPDADSLYATVRAEILGEWMDMPETYDEAGKGFQRGYNTALEVAAEKARGAIAVAHLFRTAVARNRVIRKLRRRCDRRLKLANTPRQPDPAFGDRLRADVVQDFEANITPHILRNWDRSRIVVFAKHLLGDECQECQKHNKTLDTPPRP